MNLLRSLLTSLFISVSLIASSILVFAAEVTIPSYGQFGNSTITGDIFEFPSVGTEPWAGFAAINEGGGEPYYPFIFSADGQISINAAVPSGGSATLRFVFEYQSHPNNTPNFEVTIPISGSTLTTYTETLPSQGANTFSNFVFYIVEQDTPVQIQDIVVTHDDPVTDPNAPTPGGASETTIPVEYWTPFDGSGSTIANGNEFTFPTGAQPWAGFAVGGAGYESSGENIYPFSFADAGEIDFTASVPDGTSAEVRFVFEYQPFPNVTPNYNTETVTISGATPTSYQITVPSQADNTFSSFLFYVVTQDKAVVLGDVVITDDAGGSGGGSGSVSGNNLSITDQFTIDYTNGVSGTTDVEYISTNNGVNEYAYSIDVAQGDYVTFVVNASSVTGTPQMVVNMFNPANSTEYWHDSGALNITQAGDYTIAYGESGFSADVHLKFTIKLDAGEAITIDSFVVTDSGDNSGAGGGSGSTDAAGVRFVFEEVPGGNAAYNYETEIVEITNTTPEAFSIDIPVYVNPLDTFENMLLYVVGDDQSIKVSDVTLIVNGTTYGGSGADSLLFNNIFGGVAIDESNFTYTFLSDSQSWGGFALSGSQIGDWPTSGLLLNNGATLTFNAHLADSVSDLPPLYNGENAFANGVIDTSGDTGTGRDSDPAYKWSAYVTWYQLEAGDTIGSWLGGDAWGKLSDLPATWNNEVITLAPNTASYSTWSEAGSDDGIHFLEQTLKIEGTRGTSEILGKTVNFSGTVDSYTLDSRYTVIAFIKAVDPNSDYAEVISSQVLLDSAGNFAVTADLPEGDFIPQLGFLLSGRNANPETDWGNIQISNLSGTYDEMTSITEGNFTSGANGYWGGTSGVDFNSAGGNGTIPGQVVLTNGTANRSSVYAVSNVGTTETIDNFGIVAGNTYDVSYYMNRLSGDDLGLIQFAFYVSDTQEWVYFPENITGAIHGGANPDSNTWVQYSQSIEVPASTTYGLLYIVSGANSVIAFDQLNVTEVANDFASWAADNGLSGSDAVFTADPDGDGVPNGLESFLGTLPGTSSAAMSNIAKTTNGISMSHSRNSDLASDITASYQWSTDLSTWSASGETVNGTTVTITTDDSVPGTTTANATVSGTDADSVFIKVNVSND